MGRSGSEAACDCVSLTLSIPTISEDAARVALLELAASNCCYGKAAARELIFTNITQSSAFHVSIT